MTNENREKNQSQGQDQDRQDPDQKQGMGGQGGAQNPRGGMNQGTGPVDQGQPGGHAQQKGMGADVDAQLRGRENDDARRSEGAGGSAGPTGTRQQGGGAERRGMGNGEDGR